MTNHRWKPLGTAAERGYGLAHQRIRRELLREEPHCRECKKLGLETRAVQADHIIPLCLSGPTVRENMQPLCLAHARSKTGREGAMMRNAKRRARKALEARRGTT